MCDAQSELQSDEQVQMNFGTLRQSAVPLKCRWRSKGRLSKKHGFVTAGPEATGLTIYIELKRKFGQKKKITTCEALSFRTHL